MLIQRYIFADTNKRKNHDLPANAPNVKRMAVDNQQPFDYSKRNVSPNRLSIPILKQQDTICLNRLFLLYAVENVS